MVTNHNGGASDFLSLNSGKNTNDFFKIAYYFIAIYN